VIIHRLAATGCRERDYSHTGSYRLQGRKNTSNVSTMKNASLLVTLKVSSSFDVQKRAAVNRLQKCAPNGQQGLLKRRICLPQPEYANQEQRGAGALNRPQRSTNSGEPASILAAGLIDQRRFRAIEKLATFVSIAFLRTTHNSLYKCT